MCGQLFQVDFADPSSVHAVDAHIEGHSAELESKAAMSERLPDEATPQRYELTGAEIASMKRARDHIFNMEPGDPYDEDYPDHAGADACWYVNDEGGIDPDEDPAISAELLGSETVFGLEHPYWQVTTRSGRTFWVIDEPARSCYEGATFGHITDALYQHIGVTVRMAESMGQDCPYH